MAHLLAQSAAQQQQQQQQQSVAGPSTSAHAGNRLLTMLRNGQQPPQGSPARGGEAGPSGQPAPLPAAVRALCAAFPPPEGECSFNLQRALRWLEVAAPETYAVVDKSILQHLENTIAEGRGDIASVLLFLGVAAWTTPESIAAARSATAVMSANLVKAKKHLLEHPDLAAALADLVAYRPDVAIHIDRGLWRVLTSAGVVEGDAVAWLQDCLHLEEGWDDPAYGEPRKVLLTHMASELRAPGSYGRR